MAQPGEAEQITAWMLKTGHLDEDSGIVFVGPEAERVYGHRHFMEVLSIFSSAPQFTIVNGRREIGTVDPYVLIRKVSGPRVIGLAGQGWLVTTIDWSRRRAYVEIADIRGAARWASVSQPDAWELVQAERRVHLGADFAAVQLTRRALEQLPEAREEHQGHVDPAATVVAMEESRTRWWTWAGGRANAILIAALESEDPALVDEDYLYDNRQITLRKGVGVADLRRSVDGVRRRIGDDLSSVAPFVTERALKQLKFADLLPPDLARDTLERRLSDPLGARAVLDQPIKLKA